MTVPLKDKRVEVKPEWEMSIEAVEKIGLPEVERIR